MPELIIGNCSSCYKTVFFFQVLLVMTSLSANHDNWCTVTLLNRIITAQWEGMGDVGSARYEPALLPPCPTVRVLCYSNCQRSTHLHQQFKGLNATRIFTKHLRGMKVHSELRFVSVYCHSYVHHACMGNNVRRWNYFQHLQNLLWHVHISIFRCTRTKFHTLHPCVS